MKHLEKWDVAVLPNRYPALTLNPPQVELEEFVWYTKREAWGVAEVIVETPSHEGDLFDLSLDHAVKVVETYKSEVEEYLTRECSVCLEEALKTHNPLLKALGGLINYQHVLLRDMYDVSTPGLEEIRRRALEAGAIGVKISGAGFGSGK